MSSSAGIAVQARRHNDTRREVLRAHPELRGLAGTEPLTVLALPVLLALQWGVAWLVSDGGILLVFPAALFVGQIIIHSGGALVHETARKLIFRDGQAKLAFDLGLEAILTSYGKQLTYQRERITSHHPHLGDYERDYEYEDVCAFQARHTLKAANPGLNRPMSGRGVKDTERNIGASRPQHWQVFLFVGVSLLSNLALFLLFGFYALLYHIWSLSLFLSKFGVWNLGPSLSEHHGADEQNPTRSSYGPLNWILFNTGYLAERHSFQSVPWTRLPRLKAAAPVERSYVGYWWDHVRSDFSPNRASPLQGVDNAARCASPPSGKAATG